MTFRGQLRQAFYLYEEMLNGCINRIFYPLLWVDKANGESANSTYIPALEKDYVQ